MRIKTYSPLLQVFDYQIFARKNKNKSENRALKQAKMASIYQKTISGT